MKSLRTIALLLVGAALCLAAPKCANCHAKIAAGFRQTGMSHSFYRPAPENTIEDYTKNNEYFHAASNTNYRMLRRDGKYFQRRWQVGFAGTETNIEEKQIDFIIGSGSHARTYLHRTERGTLVELPLGWYAENGGYWDMSPGYDNPHNPGSARTIGYDCMFCHNSYPTIPPGQDRLGAEPVYAGAMPEGIDCERCHGPPERHPARIAPERRMDVCMQCHLQPTSFPLPNAVKRYERGWFSYDPAEPLSAFMLYFDRANPNDDRFEIASSVYRLRKSACFLKSNGAMTCTTCHNPHQPHSASPGLEAVNYNSVCRQCHTTLTARHVSDPNCTACHMPRRHTDDVVHVVMTDHYIQRRAPADRPAREPVAYRGEVIPYYPKIADPLYTAIAQVRDQSNLTKGIPQLTRVLQSTKSARPEPWFELAEAQRNAKHPNEAVASYRESLRRDPAFLPALLGLGSSLKDSAALERAVKVAPDDPRAWNELGTVDALRKAIHLDPDFAPPHNTLGILLAEAADLTGSEAELREAIRLQPNSGDAHGNLARLLAAKQDTAQAEYEFQQALRLLPTETYTRFSYAALLNALYRFDEAHRQLDIVIAADPDNAEARDLLGNLFERGGSVDRALAEYRAAVRLRPDLLRAQLDLGATLMKKGNPSAASHLEIAAAGSDATLRSIAHQLLAELQKK